MNREDIGLADLLKYENIAWFDEGKVRILDRRVYPAKKEFVECSTYEEVAKALTDMVTQSAGPYTAAPMGMALAAWQCREMPKEKQIEYIQKAAEVISNARPTTKKRMSLLCDACVDRAKKSLEEDKNAYDEIVSLTIELNNKRYKTISTIAKYLVEKIPNNGHVMTYCFAETIIGMMLRECKNVEKDIKLFCCETRPYFQGVRLTASCVKDMGFDVTVITDGMPAFVMEKEKIDVFTTAADAICVDGHVINKVGTCNTAIVAKHFNVPYYVTGVPEYGHKSVDSVTIEMRDPEFTLTAMGVRTADKGVKGYYPSFDITPPDLVTGVVTDKGILSPFELEKYFDENTDINQVVV